MDPESKRLFTEIYALEKENNKLLRKMRQAQKYQAWLRLAYWFIIIGLGVGAFYFIQPYIDAIANLTDDAKGTFDNIKNLIP